MAYGHLTICLPPNAFFLKSLFKKVARVFATPWTVHSMEFTRPEYWNGWSFHSPGDLPNPGIKPRSPALQADSLPAEPQGKPKNMGLGSLSLLQQIFQTQESNQGFLHCRRILYQLSHKGSPTTKCTAPGKITLPFGSTKLLV